MASTLYNNFKTLLLSGAINMATAPIKVMLVSGSYNGSTNTAIDTHLHTGSIGNNEVVGAGYSRGGKDLTNKLVYTDNGNDEAVFTADNVSWSTSTITASGAVLYVSGATVATNYLIAYLDFGGDQTSSNGTFQITWNSEGIINFG